MIGSVPPPGEEIRASWNRLVDAIVHAPVAQLPERVSLCAGRRGSLADGGLAVVGRALYQGKPESSFEPGARRAAVASAVASDWIAGPDRLEEVLRHWDVPIGTYRYQRSAFWRTARHASNLVGFPGSTWTRYLHWTNLYRASPAWRNPTARLRTVQRDACIAMLRAELREWRPKRVLVLAGRSWIEPFLGGLGWVAERWSGIGVCTLRDAETGARVLIGPHPERKSRTVIRELHGDIASWLDRE